MAFDRIVILNNTSVLQDEILSQRIGLCPVKVDPDLFTERTEGLTTDLYCTDFCFVSVTLLPFCYCDGS